MPVSVLIGAVLSPQPPTIPAEAEHVTVGTPAAERPNMTGRLVLAGVILAALAVALFLGGQEQPGVTAGGSDTGHPALGAPVAPVLILNYSDFQCGFCRRYTLEVEPTLVAEYVNTGQVRMEWRDFPVFGGESIRAAIAGRAAHEQGAFWEYHGLLYERQQGVNSGAWTDEQLVAFAGELGLDTAAFRTAMADPAHQQAVQADFADGQQRGFTGTPTFVINGQVLVGAQPVEVFRQAIDEALAQTGA